LANEHRVLAVAVVRNILSSWFYKQFDVFIYQHTALD